MMKASQQILLGTIYLKLGHPVSRAQFTPTASPAKECSGYDKSSIAEQLIKTHDCAEKLSVDLFSILNKSHSSFHLKV